MERYLDQELEKLNVDLLKMSTLTETAIDKSLEALHNQDVNIAQEVIDGDSIINEQENKIEEHAIEILALFQPMASDLRFITTGMKINAELERIADLSSNIAYRTKDLKEGKILKPISDIIKLSMLSREMVKNTIDAFVKRNEEIAKDVIASDQYCNQMRNDIMTDLIKNHMEKDPSTALVAVALLLTARDLERICDHATNIAEDVIYMVQAKVVKHHPERLSLTDENIES